MGKMRMVPVVALSVMSLTMVAETALVSSNPSAWAFAGDDNGDGTPTTVGGGGGGGSAAPSGGAATGAGGTSSGAAGTAAPFLVAGAAGIGLVGMSAATRRVRTVKAQP